MTDANGSPLGQRPFKLNGSMGELSDPPDSPGVAGRAVEHFNDDGMSATDVISSHALWQQPQLPARAWLAPPCGSEWSGSPPQAPPQLASLPRPTHSPLPPP